MKQKELKKKLRVSFAGEPGLVSEKSGIKRHLFNEILKNR